jgi:hypothetical protein
MIRFCNTKSFLSLFAFNNKVNTACNLSYFSLSFISGTFREIILKFLSKEKENHDLKLISVLFDNVLFTKLFI